MGGIKFRIAVPSKEGVPVFDLHECSELAVVDVDSGRIVPVQVASIAPEDADRMLRQLEDMGIDILIVGGIHPALRDSFNRSRINLVTGVHGETVDGLVADFLDGSLPTPSYSDGHRPVE